MYGTAPNGRPLILFGLTGENMTRLMADEPVVIILPERAKGLPGVPSCVIVLCGGKTEDDIADQVANAPVAQYLRAHPASPDQDTMTTVAHGGHPQRRWWRADGAQLYRQRHTPDATVEDLVGHAGTPELAALLVTAVNGYTAALGDGELA